MNRADRRSWLRRGLSLGRRTAAALLLVVGCRLEGREAREVRAWTDQMIAGRIARPGLAYELVYRLYAPPNLDANRKFPLLLFLHGSGTRGSDNRRQIAPELVQLNLRLQAQEPVFVLAPQCPEVDKWVTGALKEPHLNFSQAVQPESDSIKLVLALLDELAQKYPIDPDRIYVAGHSSGAAGTWDIVSRHALDRFAAAVPVTGTNDPSRAPVIAKLPIWAFHGTLDDISPVQNSREMVTALRALGSPIRYSEYGDLGHDTLRRAFREPELARWLLAQRRARSDR